jgi:HEPN domain-containing protein
VEESQDAGWWLRAAERDEAVARKLMTVGFHEGAGEHLAQAAQKYLRALLAKHGRRSRAKFCTELLEEIAEVLTVPEPLKKSASTLDHPPKRKKPKTLEDVPKRLEDEGAIENLADHLGAIRSFALTALGAQPAQP